MSIFDSSPLSNNGQKVPSNEAGSSPVVSPQYVVYRRMLDETILYMLPNRVVTHDIDKAKKYPSKGSAQQACRAFGGSCHVLELRPQRVQLAQARHVGPVPCE